MSIPRPDKAEYAVKFANFIKMCDDAKDSGIDFVIVAHPWVLGDDYAEMTESLNRLAAAGLRLFVAQPDHDWKAD